MGDARKDPSISGYFPALDGVRLFACAAVVVSHCFTATALPAGHEFWRRGLTNLGRTGVDVFFSLSGFLITRLLLEERAQRGRVDVLAFYIRRALRIWPVYYVALLLGFGGAAIVGERFCRSFGGTCTDALFRVSFPAHLVFIGNWVEGWVNPPTPIETLWSVCIEEQFYLIFPVTFVFSRLRFPVFRAAAIGLVLAWCTRLILFYRGGPILHNTLAHADNLLAGAILAQLLSVWPRQLLGFFRQRALLWEALGVGALIAFNEWDVSPSSGAGEWLAYYAVSALSASLLIAALALGDGPLSRLLSRKSLRYLGQLTYATYAYHLYGVAVVWVFCQRLALGPWLMGAVRSVLALPLAFFLGYLARVVFEGRFLALKHVFSRVQSADKAGASVPNGTVAS